MAVAFGIFGALFVWRDKPWGLYTLYVAGAFLALGLFVAIVRLFLGPGWRPTRIGVPAQGEAGPIARELFHRDPPSRAPPAATAA